MRETPRTLGVLSMIFGSMIAIWSLAGVALAGFSGTVVNHIAAVGALAQKPGQPDMVQLTARLQPLMAQLAPYTYGLLLARTLFSVALILVGFGLYQRRRWARSGALGWATLALVWLAVDLTINVGIIQPRSMAMVQQVLAELPNSAELLSRMAAMTGKQAGVVIFLHLLVYAPFPMVLLALNGRRSAAADFVD
jgi:hypothetical protein